MISRYLTEKLKISLLPDFPSLRERAMPRPLPAPQVLDAEFLQIRAKILELAASLDRLDRGDGDVADDPRMRLVMGGLSILSDDEPGRAERLQLLFSQAYEDGWRKRMGI